MKVAYRVAPPNIIVFGNTYPIKDRLKSFGARFDGSNKSWILPYTTQATDFLKELQAEEVSAIERQIIEDSSENISVPARTTARSALSLRLIDPRGSDDIEADSKNTETKNLKISELIAIASNAVTNAFPKAVWVVGEIHNLTRKPRALFCTLSEIKDEGKSQTASVEVRAVMWEEALKALRLKAGEDTYNLLMSEGIQVRALCSVSLYRDRAQLSLQIHDIDPSFTQGALARAKVELLKELKSKGLDQLNKQLPISDFPFNVGLISAKDSRAYSDFLDQLVVTGFCGNIFFVNAATQGEAVSKSVCVAIETLTKSGCDLIVLTRGGGSAADLRWFDDRAMAYKIAECPIPIIAAIGHHDDTSVAEIIAHTRQKTPTAAADFVASIFLKTKTHIQDLILSMHRSLIRKRELMERQVHIIAHRLRSAAIDSMHSKGAQVSLSESKIRLVVQKTLNRFESLINVFYFKLTSSVQKSLQTKSEQLLSLKHRLNQLDPSPWILQGWTKLSMGGRLSIKSIDEVNIGQHLSVRLIDGTVELLATKKSSQILHVNIKE